MNWDDELTGPHRDIAGSTARRIGVLAGPGTGKTAYGLMRRVVRLLSEGVDPRRIPASFVYSYRGARPA